MSGYALELTDLHGREIDHVVRKVCQVVTQTACSLLLGSLVALLKQTRDHFSTMTVFYLNEYPLILFLGSLLDDILVLLYQISRERNLLVTHLKLTFPTGILLLQVGYTLFGKFCDVLNGLLIRLVFFH